MAGVFINFRTGDGHWVAQLLYEALENRFGAHRVFLASRSIKPGDDFAREIEQRLTNVDVLLAIIGVKWLSARNESGRRLDDPNDWVRHEIRTALANEATVIPVLIDGARHLSQTSLPDDIRELGRCMSLRLEHEEGHTADIATLLGRLQEILPRYVGESWRVRLLGADGSVRGAGVLLPDNLVLTSAQVLGNAGVLTAELVGLADRPQIEARAVQGEVVPRREGNRGDVALLKLAGPALPTVHAGAILRRTALSWDRPVYVCGFPAGRELDVRLHATLTGRGGSTGEWLRITATSPDNQLAAVGLAGAGVVDAESHDVIGLVVGGRPDAPAGEAWMIPIETIVNHLPRAGARLTGGAAADDAFGALPDRVSEQSESTRELQSWISRRDTGDRLRLIVGSDSDVHAVVASSSRDQQSRTSRTGPGVSRTLGSVDLALHARGKTADELARRVLSRVGSTLTREPVELMTSVPSMTIVIDAVDLAADPIDVLENVVRPLLGQGCRIVLGFRHETSPSLELARSYEKDVNSYERRLERLTAALGDLEDTERRIMSLRAVVYEPGAISDHSAFLAGLPKVLGSEAEGEDADQTRPLLSRSERQIARWLRRARRFRAQLEQWVVERKDFRGMLDAYKDMANRNGLAENLECSERYRRAHELLWHSPTDLPAAIAAFRAYREAVLRAIEAAGPDEEEPR